MKLDGDAAVDRNVGPARRLAAYGGALAMAAYLIVKVVWIGALVSGAADSGVAEARRGEWVVLNTLTVLMALIGAVIALSFARPWGARVPARVVVLCSWLGSGFLVCTLPFLLVSSLQEDSSARSPAAEPSLVPAWQEALLQASFIGLGISLAIVVPLHLLEVYPWLNRPRSRDSVVSLPVKTVIAASVVVSGLLVVLWSWWALGGNAGLQHDLTIHARMMLATFVGWAAVGSAATLLLFTTVGRPRLHRACRLVMFASSGMLVAWHAWKLPLATYVALVEPVDVTWDEFYPVAVTEYIAALLAGAATAWLLVRSNSTDGAGQTPQAARSADPWARSSGQPEHPFPPVQKLPNKCAKDSASGGRPTCTGSPRPRHRGPHRASNQAWTAAVIRFEQEGKSQSASSSHSR